MRKRFLSVLVAIMTLTAIVGAASAEKVELQFLSWFDTQMLDKYVAFANEYMQKRYPGVTVIGSSTVATGENATNKVMVSIAAGAGPDIYLLNLSNFNTAWVEQYNMMLDLTDRLNADPKYKADLPPALFNSWSYKGKIYGLPTTMGQYAIYYNREHFAQSGLPNPSSDWTIEGDFAQAIRKLAVYKSDGKLQRAGLFLQTGLNTRFMSYIMSNGGHVVDEDVTKARIGESAFIKTLELFRGFLDSNLIEKGGTGPAYDRFVAGSVSMLDSGIFYQSRVAEHAAFDWGVAKFPKGSAGRKTVANTNAWVVNPQGKHVELAWELAKAFSSAEFTEFALREGLEFPVSLSALRKHFYGTLPPNISRAEGDIWLEAVEYMQPYPKHPLMQDIWKVAQAQVNNVWNKKQGPAAAAQIAAEQINGIISSSSTK